MPDQRETEILGMIRAVLENARSLLGNRKVVLFGSRALGRARPRSDFDLAVVGPPMPLEDFFAMEEMLQELPTLYQIDLVDLGRAEKRFAERALRGAEVIYG